MVAKKKLPIDVKSCGTCAHLKRERPGDSDGVCRRFPPTVVSCDDEVIGLWPSVDATDLCGEYSRKLNS